jgi:hypothetical protein
LTIASVSALVATATASGIALGSTGGDRPPFAPAYVGTVKGTLRMPGRVDTWTVQALRFKLQNARFVRGAWGGTYLVTGGGVTFTSMATGECKSTTTASFSLGRLPWDAAAISFLQNRRDPGYGYQARVAKEHPIRVTQECADPGGSYKQQELVSPAGGLWLLTDISERLVPGRRLRGSHTERSEYGTRSSTWNLAPRR